jgi:hypothetical protein
MTQRTWSTPEVSAYLDGQLEPKRQAALEADMEHNLALRRRVEEMQQVVSLLRAEPLREPPRNYLLTSSMVAEATPRATRSGRRAPLLVLRLATSMVTLAFVITFGLTALQGNLIPGMRASSSAPPEAAWMSQDAEVDADRLHKSAEAEAGAGVMMLPEEPQTEESLVAPEQEAQTEMLLAPQPEAAPEVNGGEAATGGNLQEPEIATLTGEEDTAAQEAPVPSVSGEAAVEAPGLEDAPDSADLQRGFGAAEDVVEAEDGAIESWPEVTTMQESTDGGLSPWISRGLGIAAALLAAVTLWLTHHPASRRR